MSLRYIFRLIEAFFKRFKAIIIIGVIIGVIFFLIINLLLPNFESTNTYIGIVGKYSVDNIPDSIAHKLSHGLTDVDQNGNVGPKIAKSWESPDGGKTWIFKINPDITWQDKKKIVAKDINYEFSDATTKVIDNETIEFTLDSQFSAFPVIVSKPLFKKGLIGVGEWKVKKLSLSGGFLQKISIKNDKNDNITYKFYPSEDRLKLAFKLGAIDTIESIQNTEPFDSWKTVIIDKTTGYNNFVGLFFNTSNEDFSDKQIRQAFAYAIDKSGFEGERAIGPISPNSWAYNPQVKQYLLDISKYKEIKGKSVVISTLPNLLKTAEKIKADLEKAEVKVEIQVVTNVPSEYQMFLATIDIPKDPDQYSLWHSTQTATNISHFSNPRIDKLLEDGRTELDQETRKKYYIDFQRFLAEEVPVVFLYHPNYYSITKK